MKAPLTSALSLGFIGFVLMGESPAEAQPRPRRAPPSAVVRHATAASVAPATLPTAASAGISVAPASPGSRPAALDVAAGCVPVWIVEGRETRRLPDRCPQPRATGPTLVTPDARRAEAAPSAGDGALSGADGRSPERTPTRPVIAASSTAAPAERATSRRRAVKKKPAAE